MDTLGKGTLQKVPKSPLSIELRAPGTNGLLHRAGLGHVEYPGGSGRVRLLDRPDLAEGEMPVIESNIRSVALKRARWRRVVGSVLTAE